MDICDYMNILPKAGHTLCDFQAEFQLCRASFVVQCSFSVQGETRSDKSLPTGNRTVG